jgi:hypothetical protein
MPFHIHHQYCYFFIFHHLNHIFQKWWFVQFFWCNTLFYLMFSFTTSGNIPYSDHNWSKIHVWSIYFIIFKVQNINGLYKDRQGTGGPKARKISSSKHVVCIYLYKSIYRGQQILENLIRQEFYPPYIYISSLIVPTRAL